MKIILFCAFILLGFCNSYAQTKNFRDLIGRWEVLGDQVSGSGLVVADSSNIILTYNGEKKKIQAFAIDFSKSPIWFDFTVQDNDSMVKVQSLIELIDSSHLKWQLFMNEQRPEKFTPSKGEFFYLKKSGASIL